MNNYNNIDILSIIIKMNIIINIDLYNIIIKINFNIGLFYIIIKY